MENKRGQGMSISTVILLILGLVILVVLILGFTMGWSKILPFIGNSNNLDGISNTCNIACSTNSAFAYCSAKQSVKDGTNDKFEASCNELATNPVYSARGYGIEQCPGLCE